MSTHTRPTPTQPNSTDSPTPTDATSTTDRGPATFDPGCRRRLANLMDDHNQAVPRTGGEDD
ncbi:hypothetical protein [Halalkalicoccus ordinarius]|uniref:hypothetical protein n=1 Tax=Halalkalicoccus ordinarius TaxID=3116651 RepID=UPI00300F1698